MPCKLHQLVLLSLERKTDLRMKQLRVRSLLCHAVALIPMLQDDYHLSVISSEAKLCCHSECNLWDFVTEKGKEMWLRKDSERRSEHISEVERGEESCKSGRKLSLQAVPGVERSPAWSRKFIRLPKSWFTHWKHFIEHLLCIKPLFRLIMKSLLKINATVFTLTLSWQAIHWTAV